ncbi:MAG: KpsF/GutQ family sugar-phosphate isomerase [Luteibaculum sp.]
MNNGNNSIDIAAKAIEQVASEVLKLKNLLDHNFEAVVDLCFKSTGRLVISGIGKSALIGQKLVATFNSTGTPALFLHAADAIHGDLGMVQPNDIVMLISKSGNSPEIKVLLPYLKEMGNTTVGMTGNMQGFLAKHCDYTLNTGVERESCPNNLAPTTSTAAQLVMGDALAVTLMQLKGFNESDFAKYHPGGALGKKLYLKVQDLLGKDNPLPTVPPSAGWKEVIVKISEGRLGAVVVQDHHEMLGIITDGDIRRMLEKFDSLDRILARDIMTRNPKFVSPEMLAYEAFQLMESKNITQLPVLDEQQKLVGLIHIHDIIKEGIF